MRAASRSDTLLEPLSRRELDILRLSAENLSNLQVRRIEAVARARAAGLSGQHLDGTRGST